MEERVASFPMPSILESEHRFFPYVRELAINPIFCLSVGAAMDRKLLAGHKITHIVLILPNHPSTGPHHVTLPLGDSCYENLFIHLPRVCDFIDEAVAGGGVLFVHCHMGVSRSASCVIAYCEASTIIPHRPHFRPEMSFLRMRGMTSVR
jgi:hypothetical protein